MKKYLLFIISMLCVSIGAWADATGTQSGPDATYGYYTFDFSTGSTIYYGWDPAPEYLKILGTPTVDDVKGLIDISWNSSGLKTLDISSLSNFTVTNLQTIMEYNKWYNSLTTIVLPKSLTITESEISTLSSRVSNLQYLVVTTAGEGDTYTAEVKVLRTAYGDPAVTNTEVPNLEILGDANCTSISIVGADDIKGSTDFGTIVSNFTSTYSSKTVTSNANPFNIENGCEVTLRRPSDASTMSSILDAISTELGGTEMCKLIVEGELSDADLAQFGEHSVMSGATRIDLSTATVATGSDIANLTVPSSLTQLVLPSSINSKTFAIPAALNTRLAALSNLEYAYVPTSETQNANQKVADYVYVYKSGGLKTAFETESKLCTGVYIKVGSTAELSTLDMNFNDFSSKPTAYEFLDLSAANLRPLGARNYYSTTTSDYRIILPDNWRGDQMAVFSANANHGSCAAVYSYVGTELNILEIDDNNYRQGALAEERIVRSGTTAVNVIGGDYGENSYHSFGTKLLAAINNAASSITSVTIAVPDAPNALTFTNKNITTLNLKEVNNSSAVLNVDDASKLETLNLSGATISKATAQNITTLTTVDLTEATLAGTKNTENGEGCINLTGSLNEGLKITYVEGFDPERILPAEARTAQYANPITLADIEVTCASGIESNLQAALDAIGTGYTSRDVTVLHVTSALTADDISYIMSHMPRLRLLDLSGATYATGVDGEDVVDAMVAANKLETALVFPTNADENVNKHEVWYASQNNYMHCVGYFADATKKEMQLYGYDENVAKLATLFSSENNQAISLLPAYKADPAVDMSKAMPADNALLYPSATNTFVSAGLSQLPAICIDFTWMNASTVKDMTGLNSATHFLVVAQNSNTAATTNDPTNTTAEGGYKYGSDVWAITSFKGTASPYSTTAYFGGRQFDFSATGINETAILAYITPNGVGKVNSTTAAFASTRLPEVDRYIAFGEYDEEAIKSLENIKAKKIDLSSVTVTDANLAKFKNNEVEYLALPDGKNSAIAATSADDFAFDTACPALKAIGAYDPTNLKYTVHSTDKTVIWTDESKTEFTAQENSVYVISSMCRPSTSREAGKANGTQHVVMSGYLTLSDIQMDGADAKAGLNTNSAGSVVTADFSNAVFMNNNDMCFTAATWNGNALTSILLPTDERQNTIPARSLYNYSALTEICIPYNYEYIGNAAFYLANLGHITTTDANGALVDNGAHTFTFSKNLKEIGEAPSPLTTGEGNAAYPTPLTEPVFFSHGYHDLTDIYVLRSGYEDGEPFNPTKCYRNAFGAGPTYGWGGFNGGNVYCREKYMNGSQLYTVLHFPDLASVSNDETKYNNVKEAYTDPTRVYTKKDQTGAVDANGKTPQWPTFSELGRAYNEATRGLIWNDWTYTETNQKAGNIEGGTIITPPGNPADVSLVATPTRFNMDYTGWHEFVLALATYVAPDEKVDENNKIYRQYVKDNDWYTFCIPFDMTQEEVTLLLGVPVATDQIVTTTDELYFDGDGKVSNGESITPNTTALLPEIRTIKSVTRNASTTTVAIYTSFDLADGENANTYYNPSTTKYDANGINAASQPITIRAGYPYLIKPYKIKGTTISNLGKQVMTRYEFAMAASGINREGCWDEFGNSSKFARPYEGHKVRATEDSEAATALSHTDTDHSGQDYNYTFVGQFWQQNMPLHCFYQNSKHVWRHYMTYNAAYQWYPYICIIMVTDESTSEEAKGGKFRDEESCKYPRLQGTDAKGHDVFDKNLQLTYKNGLDDNFGASARNYQFFFDEDIIDMGDGSETTAIDRLDGVDIIPANGKVYNMNGQLVGKSLDGLSKGMYIVNGKKYVIK